MRREFAAVAERFGMQWDIIDMAVKRARWYWFPATGIA